MMTLQALRMDGEPPSAAYSAALRVRLESFA
jgi:hypothetical protein